MRSGRVFGAPRGGPCCHPVSTGQVQPPPPLLQLWLTLFWLAEVLVSARAEHFGLESLGEHGKGLVLDRAFAAPLHCFSRIHLLLFRCRSGRGRCPRLTPTDTSGLRRACSTGGEIRPSPGVPGAICLISGSAEAAHGYYSELGRSRHLRWSSRSQTRALVRSTIRWSWVSQAAEGRGRGGRRSEGILGPRSPQSLFVGLFLGLVMFKALRRFRI